MYWTGKLTVYFMDVVAATGLDLKRMFEHEVCSSFSVKADKYNDRLELNPKLKMLFCVC